MNILQSWSNSLTILKPANLKLFLLVTLKSIIETYKLLFTKFWPLIAGFVGLALLSFFKINVFNINFNLSVMLYTVFAAFIIYLIVRPSVSLKNYCYLKMYITHFLTLILAGFIFCILCIGLDIVYGLLTSNMRGLWPFENTLTALLFILVKLMKQLPIHMEKLNWFFLGSLLGCYSTLCLFFFLDSEGFINSLCKSVMRAFKMVLYNMPFVLLLILVDCCFEYGLSYFVFRLFLAFGKASIITGGILHVFIYLPITLCFWNNFYIKNIHDNFDLYFKHKES